MLRPPVHSGASAMMLRAAAGYNKKVRAENVRVTEIHLGVVDRRSRAAGTARTDQSPVARCPWRSCVPGLLRWHGARQCLPFWVCDTKVGRASGDIQTEAASVGITDFVARLEALDPLAISDCDGTWRRGVPDQGGGACRNRAIALQRSALTGGWS